MRTERLLWRIFPPLFLLALIALGVLTYISTMFLHARLAEQGISGVEETVRVVRLRMMLTGAAVIGIAFIIGLRVTSRFTQPLADMRRAARRFARGEFSEPVKVSRIVELGALGSALNTMASQLDARIGTIVAQRNEIGAVLESMAEGVIAVDRDERVVTVNRAAAEFFGVDSEQVHGRSLREVFRNYEIIRFVEEVLRERTSAERSITVRKESDRYLQLHGTELADAQGNGVGAVVVFNDVTELRRLEALQRDFVANVSHELKTPITSIKGFVETLLDGALEDPEDARRFLQIISRHTDRLYGVIDDLLDLARLEQGVDDPNLTFLPTSVKELVETVVELCGPRAAARSLRLDSSEVQDIEIVVNRALVEQAVMNLIDNAVKFTETGTAVRIRAYSDLAGDIIEVSDQGQGIAKEHLPRLFERFYRVDRARSRPGGTGLGLSIVDHVATAHGGKVFVESEPGKGSTFKMVFPRRDWVR